MTRAAARRGIPAPRTWSRAELALAAALLALAGTAWLITGLAAMPDMSAGILAGAPAMSAMPLFLVIWPAMMAAMMLPASTPFTIGVRRLAAARRARRGTVAALMAGYLVVWSATGVPAYAVLRGFDAIAMRGEEVSVRVGAVVLICAGAYQFTPLKRWCLARCRSPLALLVRHGDTALRSRAGALWVGMHHGGYCLGCCWALTVVLLAAGAMNLVWMAVLAALIALEKAAPRGEAIGFALGVAAIGLGVFLLVR